MTLFWRETNHTNISKSSTSLPVWYHCKTQFSFFRVGYSAKLSRMTLFAAVAVCYFSWHSFCDHTEGFELLLVLSGVMLRKRSLLKSLFSSSDLWRAVIACDVNQVFLPGARVYQLNAAGESSLRRNEVVWVTSDKRAIEVRLSSGEKMTGMLWLRSWGRTRVGTE